MDPSCSLKGMEERRVPTRVCNQTPKHKWPWKWGWIRFQIKGVRCPRAAEAPAGSFAGSGDVSHACPRSTNSIFTMPGLSPDLHPTRTESP